jgi:hypothetical protein
MGSKLLRRGKSHPTYREGTEGTTSKTPIATMKTVTKHTLQRCAGKVDKVAFPATYHYPVIQPFTIKQ